MATTSYRALFLSLTYEKAYSTHDHILTEASIYLTMVGNKINVLDKYYQTFSHLPTNTKRIIELDLILQKLTVADRIKKIYVYGDNQIFHKLSLLKSSSIKVMNVKTFFPLDLSKPYDINEACRVALRAKEYPHNRGTMQSIINLCGLISQNYKMRYIPSEKKLYPSQRVKENVPMCIEHNDINVFRVILHDYVIFLMEVSYSFYYIESLFQQILLNMFYPDKFHYSLFPEIDFDDENVDEASEAIIKLESDINKYWTGNNSFIDHSPDGLKFLDYLEKQ